MTDEVFDYIFNLRDNPPESKIENRHLEAMRTEFLHWYPMDLRCSGKDLIPNHLTMALFNHAAIWTDAKRYWPKAYFTNGHVMVNAEKMSKSVGNFITLNEAIHTYSADCTRMAMADAGDTQEDANFSTETANQSILRLTAYEEWAEKCVEGLESDREKNFFDQVFENEINRTIACAYKAYCDMQFRDALRLVWFEMENVRGEYRIFTDGDYHAGLMRKFMEAQVIMMSPICPHFCEHIWTKVLKKEGLCCKQAWPTPSAAYSEILHRQYVVLQADLRAFRLGKEGLKKGKKDIVASGAVIYVAKEYKPYQQIVLDFLRTVPLNEEGTGPASKEYMRDLRDLPAVKQLPKDEAKNVMQFAPHMMEKEFQVYGKDALDARLPFDELEMLQKCLPLIQSQLGMDNVEILDASAVSEKDPSDRRNFAKPGNPQIAFYT